MGTTLADLKPDPTNRRTHSARNVEMIRAALQRVGAARSIVVDEHDTVLAGNGVVEAARAAGITNVRIIDAGGDEIIAVRRAGLTDEQKHALAMYDNRSGELAAWDIEQIARDRVDGLDLQPYWTDAELAMLVGDGVAPDWHGMPEFSQNDETAFRTIKVHFDTQADVDAFATLLGQTVTDKTRYLWFPQAHPKTVDVVFTGRDDEPPRDDDEREHETIVDVTP